MRFLIWLALSLWAATAQASEDDANWDGYSWTYGDWRVSFDAHDSDQDDWLICTARTGGDGSPTMVIGVFEGDAGPPHVFPDITIEESAPRHYVPQMYAADQGYIVFANGVGAYSEVETYTDEDGIENAQMSFLSPETLPLLREMRAQMYVDAVVGDQHIMRASLNGFTAAYLKMMEQCGFDGIGVVP